MFVDFLYHLRSHGIRVTPTEWLALMEALARGHARASLGVFYHLARAMVVKRETLFDTYDRAFAEFFDGVDRQFDLSDELLSWLSNPQLPRELTEEERQQIPHMDLETLYEQFEKRLAEQKERHDGGRHWVGTGGVSPFGTGGTNPQGIRVGGSGGGRTAVKVAGERRYRNLRSDVVLDTRQMGAALRRLRRLNNDDQLHELDLEKTIDQSARNGGEIEIVMGPPRRNRLRLLLLMDVGGSMDPHAALCEKLFSAAHASTHFKAFKHYYFHNCPYDRLYSDMSQLKGRPTAEVLKEVDERWCVILVGDAYMHPYELTQRGGIINYGARNEETGLQWLQRLRQRCPSSVWLNPESQRVWGAPTIKTIHSVFPMFPLTLDGLTEAVDTLRGAKPNLPVKEQPVDPMAAFRSL